VREGRQSVAGPTGPTKTADGRSAAPSGRPSPAPAPHPSATPGPLDGGPRGRLRPPGARGLLLVLAAVLVLGGFGLWLLYGSSWLRVGKVSVTGTRVLTENQIRSAARIPVGGPLISVDTTGAERRLRAALPRLAHASVVRDWPREIRLEVRERKPELAMRNGGKYSEVDADGVRFATVGKRPASVPLLVMDLQPSANPRYFGARRLRREAVTVAASLPEPVARDTHTVRVRSYDSVSLELAGGRTVLWGSGERGDEKARTLTALMKAAGRARHFDVSVPQAPAASGS
jgi:cell division protein FtsQ